MAKSREKSMKKIGNMTVLDSSDFHESEKQRKEREIETVRLVAMNGDYPGIRAGCPDRSPFDPVAR